MKSLLGVILVLATAQVLTMPQGEVRQVSSEEPPQEEISEVSNEEPSEVSAAETKEKGAMEKCNDVMANNGLNFSSFWHGAAHGIHSLSLEEIHHFFEPDATEQNRIPVVNSNLSSEQTILFNAPPRGYDEDFKTMALKVMAYFMLNDQPDFYQQGCNTLEKLTHQYHMHEIYAAAAPIYKKMKEDPPTDPELCPCVNDVTANGILTEMVKIAKKLKYFARQPRARLGCGDYYSSKDEYNSADEYTSSCGGGGGGFITVQRPNTGTVLTANTGRVITRGKRNADNSSEEIDQLEEEYIADSSRENARKIMKSNPWRPNTLVGPDQWISYEAMLTHSMLEEEELNDFVVFMYCKLNQPGLDHARDLFD